MKVEMLMVFVVKILVTVKGTHKKLRSKRKTKRILILFQKNSPIALLNNLTSINLSNKLSFSKIFWKKMQMIRVIRVIMNHQFNCSTNTCRISSNNLNKCHRLFLEFVEQTNIRLTAPKLPNQLPKPRKPKSDQESAPQQHLAYRINETVIAMTKVFLAKPKI